MKKIEVLTGKKFGRLTVISEPIKFNKYYKYECVCDCGNVTKVFNYALTSGKTQSCGCLHKEKLLKANTKHNMCDTRFYTIWEGVVRRATSISQKNKQKSYNSCSLDLFWLDFINFYNDMYNSYNLFISKFGLLPELDKDIIGNGIMYSKIHCIWVSPKVNRQEQCCRKYNIKYTYDPENDILTRTS